MNEMQRLDLMNSISAHDMPVYCVPDAQGHCITCSDEALPYTVVSVDEDQGLANVLVEEAAGRAVGCVYRA